MTNPTTDDLIAWLDPHINGLKVANEFADWVVHLSAIRAQLLARKGAVKALKKLSFAAQTTGGTTGKDDGLVSCINMAEKALAAAQEAGIV